MEASGTRRRLLVKERNACYHVMSRTVCGSYLLGDVEKEQFRKLLRKQAAFSGVEVLTYAVMSNHFHILLRVPYQADVSDEELIKRYGSLYGGKYVPFSSMRLEDLKKLLLSGGEEADRVRKRLKSRMGDLRVFMQELKQRFGIWYNHQHGNKGTIWAERYKSVLVEDDLRSLSVVGAYIDLNAVRAEIVKDPGEYRYCGYAEAMSGVSEARKGLELMYGEGKWSEVISAYRLALYGKGEKVKGVEGKDQGRIPRDRVDEVLAGEGVVGMAEALRCRVRYFSEGMVLGKEQFVEGIFQEHRWRFGAKRKSGARKMRGNAWGDLCSMRDLQLE